MQDFFCDIFYLKSSITFQDIYKFLISEFDININVHNKTNVQSFSLSEDKIICHCPTENANWLEFKYAADDITVRVIFDNALQHEKYGNVHYLIYEETNHKGEEIRFYKSFLEKIKGDIPNKYLPIVKVNKTVDLIGDVRGIDLLIRKVPMKDIFSKNAVMFFEDNDGNFPFDKDLISRLREELWYLDIIFFRCKTLTETEFKSTMRRLECNSNFVKMNDSDVKMNTLMLMQSLPVVRICNDTMIYEYYKDKDDFSYENLKNEILKSVSYNSSVFEKVVQSKMPDYYNKQNETDSMIETQTAIRLKEQKVAIEAKYQKILKDKEKAIKQLQKQNKLNENYNSDQKETCPIIIQKSSGDEINQTVDNIQKNDGELSRLKNENYQLEQRNKILESELSKKRSAEFNKNKGYYLYIPCDESESYRNEIEDYLYWLLYEKCNEELKKCPANKNDEKSRKQDVLKSILDNRQFYWQKSETKQKLDRIEQILKDSKNGADLGKLSKEGISLRHEINNEVPCSYYERYNITFSQTPSTQNVVNRQMKEIKARFFLHHN